MRGEQAIEAILKAERVLVFVHTSTSDDGTSLHTSEFPVSRELALAAMEEVRRTGAEPNVEVLDDGRTVILGGEHGIALPQNASHFDNNNGNF